MAAFIQERTVAGTAAVIGNPPGLYDPKIHKYSHMAVVPAGTALVLVAGQFGTDTAGDPAGPGFLPQVRQAFANVATALAQQGLTLEQVVKLTVLIAGLDDERLGQFEQVMAERFPGLAPTVTLIPVPRLAAPPMLIEVEATAVAPSHTLEQTR